MSVRPAVSLDVIDVAKPCPADWEQMRGDAQVRFCTHCSLNVYNLSAMSRARAQQLVAEREGRLCVRFYRRADGTVMTQDCGGGIWLAARKVGRFAKAATTVVLTAALAPLGLTGWLGAAPSEKSATTPTCVEPSAPSGPANPAIMGDMAAPPRPVAAPRAFLGRMQAAPRVQEMKGELPAMMGAPAPLPPATQPTTRPATQPTR